MKEIFVNLIYIVLLFIACTYNTVHALKMRKKKKCFIHAFVAGACFWCLISRFMWVIFSSLSRYSVGG